MWHHEHIPKSNLQIMVFASCYFTSWYFESWCFTMVLYIIVLYIISTVYIIDITRLHVMSDKIDFLIEISISKKPKENSPLKNCRQKDTTLYGMSAI